MAGHEQLPVRSERSARVTVGQKSLDDGFWKSPHTGALPIVVVADQSRLTDVRFTVECKDDPPGSAVPLNPINCTFGFGKLLAFEVLQSLCFKDFDRIPEWLLRPI